MTKQLKTEKCSRHYFAFLANTGQKELCKLVATEKKKGYNCEIAKEDLSTEYPHIKKLKSKRLLVKGGRLM